MRLPSVMSHSFSQIPKAEIPRSAFDRSHGIKTGFNAGYLVPVFWDEALPGDTFNLNATFFGRLATPIKPIMDNMYLDTQFFAVPLRLIWTNFQKCMGEQTDPGDSIDYLAPIMTHSGFGAQEATLHDYFGIPTNVVGLWHNAFLHRAYNLIWNEWYRDENLQDSVTVDKGDTASNPANYVLLKRGKRHDYFTSCLPWPQKGDSVPLPLGDSAPVLGIGKLNQVFPSSAGGPFYEANGASRAYAHYTGLNSESPADDNKYYVEGDEATGGYPQIRADLSDATAATINELRQAFQLQRLLERDARGGTRYTEIIRSHFGVISPDMRLQRPEYLGGGSTPINIHPIGQTSRSEYDEGGDLVGTPQGNLAAMGTMSASGHGFSKSFTEHCVIIGLASVRADLNYQQGLDRMMSRRGRYDFFWPALSHIGEQPVLNKEIFAQGPAVLDEDNNVVDEMVFGYQERYAEYRYKRSQITGPFRSNSAVSLDFWHLAQDFAELPELGPDFIQENPPVERCVQVEAGPQILLDGYFRYKCARPMPVYSVPGKIDHF